MIKKLNILFTQTIPTLKIIIIFLIMIFNVGCNILQYYISNQSDIEQGIYLTKKDMQKVKIGMTKNEVCNNIGSPVLQDLFKINIWYYIYYHFYVNNQSDVQIIELIFNSNNVLTTINYLQ